MTSSCHPLSCFAFSHLVSNMITNIPKLPHSKHSSSMEIRAVFPSTHLSISNHMLIPESIIVVKEMSTLICPPGCCDFPEMNDDNGSEGVGEVRVRKHCDFYFH